MDERMPTPKVRTEDPKEKEKVRDQQMGAGLVAEITFKTDVRMARVLKEKVEESSEVDRKE